jgi:hypothetical protein
MMNKIHQIHIPIYEQYIDVWFGDKDECKKALEKKKLPKDCIDFFYETMNKSNGASCQYRDEIYNLFWMPDVPKDIFDLSTFVHEIEHGTFYILDYVGVKHDMNSDEAFAYLSGYIFGEIYKIVDKIKKQQ